jgi:dTDP-4-amino-4,6-dideoxygalactose transaminase
MRVPLLDLKAQFAGIRAEIKPVVDEIMDSQSFILGPKVEALERAVAAYSGAKFAIGVSSGTDALLVALMALDIKPGDEVITTPFTFFATAGVIARMQAIPVFVDIDPATFNIDPNEIEKAVTIKTKAIIPVHLFGQCAQMAPILEMASHHGIPVIEDAAQSIGAEYRGKRAGSMGNLGIFSFFPSKNLGGFGDGGMVITNDVELADKIKLLRHHGAENSYDHRYVGGNFRLDALQAAVLSVKLGHLEKWSAARRRNADYYNSRFTELGLLKNNLVALPVPSHKQHGDANCHIYNQYTLRVKDRDKLRAYLINAGIGSAVYYPLPLHLQECFRYLGYKGGDFPISEKAAQEVLSIPIYPELTLDQKEYVVEKIYSFYQAEVSHSEYEN